MTIPIWIFIATIFASFASGLSLGYIVKSPSTHVAEGHCFTLDSKGTYNNTTVKVTTKNARPRSVVCPYVDASSTRCSLLDAKCKMIV